MNWPETSWEKRPAAFSERTGLIVEASPCRPEWLVEGLADREGTVLLRSGVTDATHGRYSYVTAEPFLTVRTRGAQCEVVDPKGAREVLYGSPWEVLRLLLARYELVEPIDWPFPLGGCFGYFGYELRHFVEPGLSRSAVADVNWPDCEAGFYDSLVVFDHWLGQSWIVSTGLGADGRLEEGRARTRLSWWEAQIQKASEKELIEAEVRPERGGAPHQWVSSFGRDEFIWAVRRAQEYIRRGDIYQVNLAQRLVTESRLSGWEIYARLAAVSPAPFSAYYRGSELEVASSSPELFLRLSGSHVTTRPIKGTRPRSPDPDRDAQLTYELQTSGKEMAELVMITDLLRNDLGRVCAYGSVRVPELVRLERYAQVQHLVSTVQGELREKVSHFEAFAACFPGGSITGAPKIRAMEIIDELEPVTRGVYTGCIGYLGFNFESQMSIAIRTAIRCGGQVYFYAGAGIVADSVPEQEYLETLAKAAGFMEALGLEPNPGT